MTEEEKKRVIQLLRRYAIAYSSGVLYKDGSVYCDDERDAEDLADKLEAELNVNKCGAV